MLSIVRWSGIFFTVLQDTYSATDPEPLDDSGEVGSKRRYYDAQQHDFGTPRANGGNVRGQKVRVSTLGILPFQVDSNSIHSPSALSTPNFINDTGVQVIFLVNRVVVILTYQQRTLSNNFTQRNIPRHLEDRNVHTANIVRSYVSNL